MIITNRLKVLTALTLFVLASYFFWNLYPVQNYIGRFLQVNPKRGQQVYESLQHAKNRKLIYLLSHGDLAKSSKAALVLADRANPALYDKVVKKMQTETHELNKEIMEHLLGALDLARATKYYYQQMNQYAPSSKDYWRYIGYLVSYKAEGIFDLLMEKAKQPDAWNTPLEHYLARYGDPRALPVLQELKSKIPNDGSKDAWYATREIDRAIKKLEEIQSVSESKTVSAAEIKDQKVTEVLGKGIAVVDPWRAVVYKGGETGGSEAIVQGLELKFDGRQWAKKVHTTRNPEVIQYLLPGEDDKNWTEIITIHKFRDPQKRFNLNMINQRMESSPEKVNIISRSETDLIYDGFTQGGSRYELARVIIGDGVIFTLFYASRDISTQRQKREEWLKLLKEAKLI